MRHIRSVRFDVLEERTLLSRVHAVAVHPERSAPTSLAIVGTLSVDSRESSTTMNADSSVTTAVPVSGQLGSLGKFQGVWNASVDSFGNYQGPDVVRLHNSKGTLVIAFNNQSPGRAHPDGPGTIEYQHPQRLISGTGAYARSKESGTIEIVANSGKTVVKSLVLNSES